MSGIWIPGIPQPKGSPHPLRRGEAMVLTIHDEKGRLWQQTAALVLTALPRGRSHVGYGVDVTFYLPRPKKPVALVPTGAPDLDKLQRALGDALEAAQRVPNDAQIVVWNASKSYAEARGPGTAVRLYEV